jgi:hypothetical protein
MSWLPITSEGTTDVGSRLSLQIYALAVVCFTRLGLWLLPYKRLSSWARLRPSQAPHAGRADLVTKYVVRAARFVPGATCLTQAMAAQLILGRFGVGSTVRIGMFKGPQGEPRAHAWLLVDSRVVLNSDGIDLSQCVPIKDLPLTR